MKRAECRVLMLVVLLVAGCGGKSTPATATLKVINSLSVSIDQVYLSPVSQETWGVNQLSQAVPPGGSVQLTSVPAGSYDVKEVASNGAAATLRNVQLVAGATFTLTVAPGALKLVNLSGQTVWRLRLSPTSSDLWGPDQLGTSIVASGNSFTLGGVPPGAYDLRAELYSGAYRYASNFVINSASTTTVTVTY
ncbi:MAG: hypothetical protein ABR567_02655 [Myxococcales bacterium]|nr:hypothetical protein [Myxococcales bacterium]